MNAMAWLVQIAAVLVSCLREIFDESAYMRFLRQHQMRSSPEAYAEFYREHATARSRRPCCC
jgi:hypothetical protein